MRPVRLYIVAAPPNPAQGGTSCILGQISFTFIQSVVGKWHAIPLRTDCSASARVSDLSPLCVISLLQVSIWTSRPLFIEHISMYSCRCRFMSLFAVASSIWRERTPPSGPFQKGVSTIVLQAQRLPNFLGTNFLIWRTHSNIKHHKEWAKNIHHCVMTESYCRQQSTTAAWGTHT